MSVGCGVVIERRASGEAMPDDPNPEEIDLVVSDRITPAF